MKSIVHISLISNIKIYFLKNIYYFIFPNLNYCLIPKNFFFKIDKNFIIFYYLNEKLKKKFFNFINLFKTLIKKNNTFFTKKLLLKGLGLKAILSPDLTILELKLGFSHSIKIKIPKNKINIKLIKNTIIATSSNLVTLGNYLYKIRNFKKPNIYKGKGIWYKNENIKLKIIKKN